MSRCSCQAATYLRSLRSYSTKPRKTSQWRLEPFARFSLGLGVAVATLSGVVLYSTRRSMTPTTAPEQPQTFTIPIPSRTGERTEKTLALMTPKQVEARLQEHQESYTLNRPNNPVYRFDTAWLASNSPIEDDHAVEILSRDDKAPVQGDLVLFGVFDGHAGWQTSRLVAEKLIGYVARELNAVFSASPEYEQLRLDRIDAETSKQSQGGRLGYLARLIKGGGVTRNERGLHLAHLDQDDGIVQQAIKNAFVKLDDDICQAPVRELESMSNPIKLKGSAFPSTAQTLALQSLLPALSGSCALVSYMDTARNKLHVACTGDSRAIMGTLQDNGKWKVQVLSEDQTGRNPSEVKRIQAEHPASEKNTVISNGRVLGGLEPTRAFGDAVYKYQPGLYNRLIEALHPGSARRMRPGFSSPPYVTARPEVVTTDLLPDSISAAAKPPKRFVVLATDGLWDRLENDTVVALVGAWLDGQKEPLSEKELLARVIADDHSTSISHEPRTKRNRQFVFQDSNLSTHLIRNSLGGADTQSLTALLSIPAPLSRRYRDDQTVMTILLGEEGASAPEGVRVIKAKL